MDETLACAYPLPLMLPPLLLLLMSLKKALSLSLLPFGYEFKWIKLLSRNTGVVLFILVKERDGSEERHGSFGH